MGRNSQELLGQVKQIESRLVQRIEDVEKNPILQQDQGKGILVVRLNNIYLVQKVERPITYDRSQPGGDDFCSSVLGGFQSEFVSINQVINHIIYLIGGFLV